MHGFVRGVGERAASVGEHAIFINNVRWERGWRNRAVTVNRAFIAGCARTALKITNYCTAVPQSAPPVAVVLLSTRYSITAKIGYNLQQGRGADAGGPNLGLVTTCLTTAIDRWPS